jgi:hypothetical protein
MMDDDGQEARDLASVSLTSNPLAVLGRQAQQIAFYTSVPAEARAGLALDAVSAAEVMARTDLPSPIVRLLDEYERGHPGIQLRPLRLVQFDGRDPTVNPATSAPLPDVDQLVTFNVTETVVTPDALTVRSYLLLAQRETAA